MLRISLWNTYGSETIKFDKEIVTYEADYGWFKDGKKTVEISPLVFQINRVGYDDENKGVLCIGNIKPSIDCVTKMPINQIEKLMAELNENNIT